MLKILIQFTLLLFISFSLQAKSESNDLDCAHLEHHGEFDAGATAFHHIADANVYSIGPLQIPLPCMTYAKGQGWDFFLSNRFKFDRLGHGDGHQAYNRYVLDAGTIKRVHDDQFPMGAQEVGGFIHRTEEVDGKDKEVAYVCFEGKAYKLDAKSTADGGLFGGGITSFYDFSMTKNVTTMIIVFLFLTWLFLTVAKAYKTREGKAPKGVQSFIEPMFLFIQDEVAKPFLGHKYMTFLPFLMALFFFILALNLFGQIPFFGGSNVTGNLAVTMVLALLAFLVTNFNGKKDYWQHIFWMPGVPAWVKTILTPVEFLGMFIKPLTLMLRLFANITAGHMVVIIFVSLIFIFSKNGESIIGGYGTAIPSILLTMFMMAIELLVAFIQAFVFTILTASYIGAAIEEHH
jgi:F-type H+-transporting ATPase subunit a